VDKFNQFVQQQTDFYAQHLHEFTDLALPEAKRLALAEATRWIAIMIHGWTIGNAGWYRDLIGALDGNIGDLQAAEGERSPKMARALGR
jgi:hypothetical protein